MAKKVIGIDIGSTNTKAVLFDGSIKNFVVFPTLYEPQKAAKKAVEYLTKGHIGEIIKEYKIVATGYGRVSFDYADKKVSEITCHARGTKFLFPDVKTIIDLGGQDSKLIFLDETGKVKEFFMNDKCSAGTGKFLEYILKSMKIAIKNLDIPISIVPAKINSMCTVFAESEVISLSSKGVAKEEIIAGIINSIAERVTTFLYKFNFEEKICFTGGLSKNQYLKFLLEQKLNKKIYTPEYALYSAAIGAALIGYEE